MTTRPGPRFFVTASQTWEDPYLLRVLLSGLNSYGREWQEEISILTNNDFVMNQDGDFRYLKFLEIAREELFVEERVNIVLAFVKTTLSGRIKSVLDEAIERGVPAYAVVRAKK